MGLNEPTKSFDMLYQNVDRLYERWRKTPEGKDKERLKTAVRQFLSTIRRLYPVIPDDPDGSKDRGLRTVDWFVTYDDGVI